MTGTKWLAAAAMGSALWLAGCGDDGQAGSSTGQSEEAASTSFNLTVDPSFVGNSVQICGKRVDKDGKPLPADGKYPCSNEVLCTCFQFDQDGKIVKYDSYGKPQPAGFDDLCPSNDLPKGFWQFDYTLFADAYCSPGKEMTGGYNNLACFDSSDIYNQAHPNQSIEYLKPGKNTNEVDCITRNASKTWDFNVCVDKSTQQDYVDGTLRLNCGCYPDPDPYKQGQCVCDQDLGNLPYNCKVDPYNYCNVVCTKPPQP